MKENLHIKRLLSSTCTAYITNISQEIFTRLYVDHGIGSTYIHFF